VWSQRIRAVLFDSGGVLIRPVGGRWNPRFDFEPTVQQVAPHLTDQDFRRAIQAGERFFESAPADHTRDDYHRAMLWEIGVPPTADLLLDLRRPLDPATVEPYPEVLDVLNELAASGVRMAVVSDNQPGLETLHDGLGIAHFFEAYAISAELGCTKPDPRMYAHASDSLGLDPAECLFVDDVPRLVTAAIELGYQGCAVLRDGSQADEVPTVSNLRALLPLIGAELAGPHDESERTERAHKEPC
jgi:HAD superfamily hydrolase (TIGR01509 family)